MEIDVERLKRQVANITAELASAESSFEGGTFNGAREGVQRLHDALFVGLAVLESELGVLLAPIPVQGRAETRSGGSGKDRPDVTSE